MSSPAEPRAAIGEVGGEAKGAHRAPPTKCGGAAFGAESGNKARKARRGHVEISFRAADAARMGFFPSDRFAILAGNDSVVFGEG